MTKKGNKALGMDEGITRRDFLNSTLIASGAALLSSAAPGELLGQTKDDDWNGYGGVGDYANANGNTQAVVNAGHEIRDKVYKGLPADMVETGEVYDCVIVGGGISGLAAALLLQQQTAGKMKSLVLENHAIFGGEARRNEFEVDGQRLAAHQGSAMFWAPFPYSFIGRFYDSIGLKPPELKYQTWAGSDPEFALPLSPYDIADRKRYGFYFSAKAGQQSGTWVIDPWAKKLEGAPIPAKAKAELLAMWQAEGKDQRPKYPGDAISRHLDSVTIEQHLMETYALSRETIRAYLSDEGSGSGLGPDALSAYSDYAADFLYPMDDSGQMFPGGNTGIARMITKTLIPEAIAGEASVEGVARGAVNFAALDRAGQTTRIRLNSTAVWVEHEGAAKKSELVNVAYVREGKIYRVKARTAIMAGGCWTTKHIVRDLPAEQREAYGQFYRSPCLMANVAVRNWRFLYNKGIVGCRWFGGLGNYTSVRRMATCGPQPATITPDSPTVLTIKHIYSYPGMPTAQQGVRGRFEMLGTPYAEYERQIREQFTAMFAGSGFDAKRDIAGIILNRWGHAYLNPQPGFFFGKNGKPAPSDVLRAAPFGRIAFANTDLAGIMDHRCSILEANRAVGQLCEQVLR
jgi:spermidine dehydrogenase